MKSSNGASFHTLNNGEIFGEIEVLKKEFRMCSAQAHNRCLLFALNRVVFSKMIEDYPQVCREVDKKKIFSKKFLNIYKKRSQQIVRTKKQCLKLHRKKQINL